MKSIRPIVDLARLTLLRFLRDTSLPLSPHLPSYVVRINALERRHG